MRKMQHIRTAIAVLLLSVVLPITLVLPFHHHEIEEVALEPCELCATHQSHPGHLVAANPMDNCLVCQFLGVTYLPEETADAPAKPHVVSAFFAGPAASVASVSLLNLSTRAPPFSFC